MLKKIFSLLVFPALLLNSPHLKAQSPQPAAQIKYKILDYKNPSTAKGRFGLTRFSADDSLLAVVGDHDRIVIYETATGKALQSVKYGNDNTIAFSFDADGRRVLMQDRFSYDIEVWDLETGQRLHKIEGRSGVSGLKKVLLGNIEQKNQSQEMRELPISPDGKNLLLARTDSRYDVVDIADGGPLFSLEQRSTTSDTKDLLKIMLIPGAATSRGFFHVSTAAYNRAGTRIVLANGDKLPTLWDAATGKLIADLKPQISKVYEVSFSTDGSLVSTTGVDGVTKIWDAATGANLSTIGTPKKSEIAYAWSSQSEVLATYSSDEKGHFYDARTGRFLAGTGKLAINGLKFNPAGNSAATFSKKDKSKLGQIINVADGRLIANLPRLAGEEHPLAVDWSADGKLLAVSSVEYVKIFNDRGELLQTLENAVFPARFSHDGRLLSTGGKNDDGFVWQIEGN